MEANRVKISHEQIAECGRIFTAAFNPAQKMGFTVDQVLIASAYALGAAIGQRGAAILPTEPLQFSLPSLVDGYNAARRMTARDAKREEKP